VVLRYGEPEVVSTPLDPLEDIMSLICGLRSVSYVADILRSKHGVKEKKEIVSSSRLIVTYVDDALGLIAQAFSGPPEVSFLPLYYAILNLSKIYILMAGKRTQLERNRHHGASYPFEKRSRDLLTEQIYLHPKGVLGLFYEVLTHGEPWISKSGRLSMKEVYPFIYPISAEYEQAYGSRSPFQPVDLRVTRKGPDQWQCELELKWPIRFDPRKWRYIQAFRGFRPKQADKLKFVSDIVQARDEREARRYLQSSVRSFMLYSYVDEFGKTRILIPLSRKRLLLPEELPIWLAFFHLSNVVRYRPEFLSVLRDSKSWPMLLALRKHATFRFLVLFWSYVQQTVFGFARSG